MLKPLSQWQVVHTMDTAR